jgi:hypothetical protein
MPDKRLNLYEPDLSVSSLDFGGSPYAQGYAPVCVVTNILDFLNYCYHNNVHE